MATSFHLKTDGRIERLSKVLKDMLKPYVSSFQDDWDEYFLMIEFAYNNSWQGSIKTTHFLLKHDKHPSTSVNRRISGSQVPTTKDFALAMSNIISKAKKNLLVTQQRQTTYVDTK